ncbi:phage tail spike protein [Weissella confusa]|uniref:phage tail spike protein n=1 Tax=Weissella confusa TaxID=1583 RepID=UPI00070550F4|nr:phage tail spike protein [Weissella confusa]MBJ7698541.1 hypothetical protein [Weissella confusa]MBS7550861.1 hypothetical protein [Weissella confusa]MCQ8096709.1 hypothetical protein [Weissella confusa]MCQ8145933.1 hypothetical protein [Weissella confusa]GEO56769.1 hypothetical protein WCO01_19710 [Weissella confusa]
MTPILYSSEEIDFLNNGLGQLVDLYDVDIHEQRNGLLNLTAYYPVNGQHYADISEGNIILAKPSPLDDNHAFRIVSVALDITGYAVMIEADSITYDLTNNLSKTIHMLGDGQAAMTAIQKSTLRPHIFTFYSDITHTSESQLRYVNPMEAIAGTQGSFLQIWGGELKRENRRVAMFNRRGRDNVATFRLGKNIAGLKYTVDVSKLTTEIVPTVTVNSTDVSRTIEGATVQSSRMGNYPLVYSKMVDVSQDVKVDEGDTDDQIKAKINAFAADWFVKSANTGKDLPEVTVEVEVESLQDSADYADKFAKLETIGLTDTVTVYVPEFGVNVTAIVNELHYDPVAERVTKLSIGISKVSWADSNKNALNELQDKVTEVKEQATQAVISANGKNSIYSGRNAPAHPQEGDTWFWEDGENSGIKVFKSGDWVDVVDTQTQERITNEVKNAVDTATAYADKLNSTQAEATNSLADELAEKSDELTKSQQTIASQASAYTDSAVADANAKAVQIGQTTAQNAQKALDEAKQDLTSSLASQASQTASMASDVTSKANQYASQAKSEAIAAATSADGVVRTEFKETTDSMTATIQQNKSDADGKISTAQTTATQALDGLSTKVEKTEYNQKTGELSSKINETYDTAEQSKQDIVDIKETNSKQDNRMLEIEKNAEGIKQTVSDLSTEQGKQSGYISTLKQRADGFDATVTKVNNLQVGGRNLYTDTKNFDNLASWWGSSAWAKTTDTYKGLAVMQTTGSWNGISQYIPVKKGDVLTYSVYAKNISGTGTSTIYWALNNDPEGSYRTATSNPSNSSVTITDSWRIVSGTTVVTADGYLRPRLERTNNNTNTLQIAGIKVEKGNLPTDWTPAPEDLSGATAKAQLTADNATLSINNYKTDADQRISKAQADIKVNADNISTKVEKSDYDKKTGDLTTSVNKAQQTADTATQTIGTYKTSNDNRVSAAETAIKANSDAIKLTVSKTDFDQATGKLSGDISTLQQRADGFEATVTKVNNLAVGGRNYVLDSDVSTSSNITNFKTSIPVSGFSGKKIVISVQVDYDNITGFNNQSPFHRVMFEPTFIDKRTGRTIYASTNILPKIGDSFHGRIYSMFDFSNTELAPVTSDANMIGQGIYVQGLNSDTPIVVSKPMIEIGTQPTDWSPAPEDVDTQLAQVKITADGVYQTVNNPQTGLNTRVSTAEGNINKVQGAVGSMSTTVTQTADGLTREIADRKTGDSNTLQAGKDFTTSQIKNYDSGVQSQITQASNAIMASVSVVNLLSNTTFDNNGAGWTKRSSGDANTIFVGKTELPNTPSYLQTSSNSQAWTGLEQVIKAIPGTIYNVSSYLVSTKNSGIAQLYVRFEDASNKNLTNFMQVGASTGTDWIQVNKDFTAPSNTAYLRFSFQNQMANSAVAMTMPQITEGAGVKLYSPVKYAMDNQTVLQLFQDNWAIGIKDNAGNLINGINGDPSGMTIAAKKLTVSADTTFLGTNWLNGAVIKDASISNAQIADASITSAKIVNLDVNKISGEVANFIRAYWDGQYGSTSITSEGMTVSAGVTTTVFDENGMQLNKSNRSVGRIGVNDLYQDNSKKGLYFGLESTGDFMAWGAQNYAGNPYDTKLSWYRAGSVPSNLIGTIEGFNFQDNVLFNRPVEMRAGIKVQGTDDRLVTRTTSLNGRNSPSFGTSSAGFAYVSDEVYLISNGTAYNLSKVIKALSGISNAAIPTGFASDGKAVGWYNVNFR